MSTQVSQSYSKGKNRRFDQSSILNWRTIILLGISAWLSCSLLLDLVIMPSLYSAGMMSQSGFASAGYSIFWVFNRIELVFAALVLTGVLALCWLIKPIEWMGKGAIILAVFLLAIPLIYTYALTPTMVSLGLELTPFSLPGTLPLEMNQLHWEYFGLEFLKIGVGSGLLGVCYRLTH